VVLEEQSVTHISENRDTIKDDFLKSCLIRTVQNKDFHPETVVLIGNGAIIGGNGPLYEALDKCSFIKLPDKQHQIFHRNPSPANLLAYYSHFFSTIRNRSAAGILRHSYATDFLDKTDQKIALQGQLGHSSSKQTDHYAKITSTKIQEGVWAYNRSFRDPNVIDFLPKLEEKNHDRLGKAGTKKEPSEKF